MIRQSPKARRNPCVQEIEKSERGGRRTANQEVAQGEAGAGAGLIDGVL